MHGSHGVPAGPLGDAHSIHPHQSSGTSSSAHQPPRRLSEDGEAQHGSAYLGRAARVKQGRMEKLKWRLEARHEEDLKLLVRLVSSPVRR